MSNRIRREQLISKIRALRSKKRGQVSIHTSAPNNADDFDWSVTDRELVIFIPNYKRKKLLEFTLRSFRTMVPRDRWCFLIVNDGVHEDLSDLKKYNLHYFTLYRRTKDERNGAAVRNYVIKRVMSKNIFTRDPEIAISGDDHVLPLMDNTNVIVRSRTFSVLTKDSTNKLLTDGPTDMSQLELIRYLHVRNQYCNCIHAGSLFPVSLLRRIGGYDEEFLRHGSEDKDLMIRIRRLSYPVVVSERYSCHHLWHPVHSVVVKQDLARLNNRLLKRKLSEPILRNDENWGSGLLWM